MRKLLLISLLTLVLAGCNLLAPAVTPVAIDAAPPTQAGELATIVFPPTWTPEPAVSNTPLPTRTATVEPTITPTIVIATRVPTATISPALFEGAEALLEAFFATLEAEDLDGHLATIHLDSPIRDRIEGSLPALFENNDVDYSYEIVEYVDVSTREMTIRLVQTAVALEGEGFVDERTTSLLTLRPIEGEWKLYDIEVEETAPLDDSPDGTPPTATPAPSATPQPTPDQGG